MNYFKFYKSQVRKLPRGSYSLPLLLRNFGAWKSSIQPGKNTLDDGMPWMTFDAIRFLKKNIRKEMNVFEYGSGGSSVFFAHHAREVISIEHDKKWLDNVKLNIEKKGLTNWKGLLVLPVKRTSSSMADPSDPEAHASSDDTFVNYDFSEYAGAIDKFPDGYFDLVVVDGRARPSCIKHAVSKLKKRGYLLLDNADREHYAKAIRLYMTEGFRNEISTFGPTSYSLDFTQTIIRRKEF